MSGVIVSATEAGATAHADTTGATGSYILRVPYGRYNVEAERDGYTFTMATDVSVPNDGSAIDNLVGTVDPTNANLSHLHLSGVTLERSPPRSANEKRTTHASYKPVFDLKDNTVTYQDTVAYEVDMTTVTADPAAHGAGVDIDPGDDSSASGHQVALEVGENDIEVTVTALDKTTEKVYSVLVYRRAESTTIEGTVTDADGNGIGSVKIAVMRSPTDTVGKGSTNSNGQFSVVAESGGLATVTPSKTGYTFDPADREVTLQANATVTGIDFTGSTNATITGRVTAGGDPLSGATVTASPRGVDPTDDHPNAITRSSGTFRITNVSTGWNTVSVEKDGYSFTSRDVFVTGGSIDIGDLEANGTIQPANVMAVRDPTSDTDGAFDGNVTVTWDAGGDDAGVITYQVEACVPNEDAETAVTCEEASDNWGPLSNSPVTAGDPLTATESVPGTSDGGFVVRVRAMRDAVVEGSVITVSAADETSAAVPVRANQRGAQPRGGNARHRSHAG